MALPPELTTHCRETLLRCSEFDNHNSLRAAFVTAELRIFQNDLPECSTKSDRVSQTLAYLIPQRLTDNRPVLPLFLVELRNRRYEGDALHDELDQLRTEVDQALTGKIVIPFVIVAMKESEAIELMDETVFHDNPNVPPAELTLFQQFKQALQEHGSGKLVSHYGGERESWKPLACPNISVGEIVSDILDHINNYHRGPRNLPRLLPYFLSEDFVLPEDFTAEDRIARRRTLRQLQRSGGVIVVDAVSMFHPMLNRSISRSDIGSYRRAAILVISPVDTNVLEINQLIEQVVDSQMEAAFTRFDVEFDHLCEIGAGNSRALKRWLFTALHRTAIGAQDLEPNPAVLERLAQQRGETPSGYGPADFMALGRVR